MNFEFIADLDEYFCEKYANYDKLCILPGYHMPKMQETREDAFGRRYSYTLPANTMSLANQAAKTELLATLKEKLSDKTFSFSFRPLGFFAKISDKFARENFRKTLQEVAHGYNVAPAALGAELEISPKVWKKILRGSFYPSKNLIFSLAISAHFNYRETKALLQICGYDFDFTEPRDVVLSYLLYRGVYNQTMVDAALAEYKLEPLLIKRAD